MATGVASGSIAWRIRPAHWPLSSCSCCRKMRLWRSDHQIFWRPHVHCLLSLQGFANVLNCQVLLSCWCWMLGYTNSLRVAGHFNSTHISLEKYIQALSSVSYNDWVPSSIFWFFWNIVGRSEGKRKNGRIRVVLCRKRQTSVTELKNIYITTMFTDCIITTGMPRSHFGSHVLGDRIPCWQGFYYEQGVHRIIYS